MIGLVNKVARLALLATLRRDLADINNMSKATDQVYIQDFVTPLCSSPTGPALVDVIQSASNVISCSIVTTLLSSVVWLMIVFRLLLMTVTCQWIWLTLPSQVFVLSISLRIQSATWKPEIVLPLCRHVSDRPTQEIEQMNKLYLVRMN
jgi:hypothetical protein